jgi:hypothetical protein
VRRARRLRRRRRRRPLLQVLACHVRLAGRRHDAAGSERTRGRERRTSLRVRDRSGSGCVRWSTSRVRLQDHRPPRSRCHAQESPLAERPSGCRDRRTPRPPPVRDRHLFDQGLISGFGSPVTATPPWSQRATLAWPEFEVPGATRFEQDCRVCSKTLTRSRSRKPPLNPAALHRSQPKSNLNLG